MKTSEIREKFLSYYESKGHTRVQSGSLIPGDDPTLLFVNAGMVPFKDCFLGQEDRGYNRATSCQKSLRISGKHNDLENVGRTARHHTFFEMLGNFSFGDYFKTDAIVFAWQFLTEDLGLDKSRLWVTIFDDDDEAEELWKANTDVLPGRILRCGEKDNFWSMGDTGPCGPCSEIHYFLGADGVEQSEVEFRKDDGTYIEIWNLVFMQFNRDVTGKMEPLPKPSVDTGMGLERIAAVKQGVLSNYDTDEFRSIIAFTEKLSSTSYDGSDYTERDTLKDKQYETDIAHRVVADHVRAASFLIADGISPSSEGRGYVLRRLIRRACRHARNLGLKDPFLFKVSEELIKIMGSAYLELEQKSETIVSAIKKEEEKFLSTLDTGISLLSKEIKKAEGSKLDGRVAFQLHDTYGFPLDMTEDIVLSHGMSVDREQFHEAMEQQRERSREARSSSTALILQKSVKPQEVQFVGYNQLEYESNISGIFGEAGELDKAAEGEQVAVVCKETPFYAESGGQVGDTGSISSNGATLDVIDTQKVGPSTIVHICQVSEGELAKGDKVRLSIESERRQHIRRSHSATHLLHLALREVLGGHVKQAGSRVSEKSFRFDFSHDNPITASELESIQEIITREILLNSEVETNVMGLEDAKKAGAMALFGEKYGDEVRVVKIGEHSLELCGGTHVSASGEIGSITILSEGAVSSGVRRVEAVCGMQAFSFNRGQDKSLREISRLLSTPLENSKDRVEKLVAKNKELEAKLNELSQSVNLAKGGDLVTSAEDLPGGVKLVASSLDSVNAKQLREVADDLRNRLGSGCIALASVNEGKAIFLTAITPDLTKKFHAGNLIKEMASIAGSRGGGKADLAQAGGGDPDKVTEALEKFRELVR